MYLNQDIEVVGWKDFVEFKQAYNRIHSDNLEEAFFGSEQLYSWIVKASNNVFLTASALACKILNLNKIKKVTKKCSAQVVSQIKYLALKHSDNFPADDPNYALFQSFACLDDNILPPLNDIVLICEVILKWIDEIFWVPIIQKQEKLYKQINTILCRYFKGEIPFDQIFFSSYTKIKFLSILSPFLIESICKSDLNEDHLFGVNRSELLQKLPDFIRNATETKNSDYPNAFALELADYLLKGSENASSILDYLINQDLFDVELIVNYVKNAPQQSQASKDFLQKHPIDSDQSKFNIWQCTPIGEIPYESISPIEYEIDNSWIAILSESEKTQGKSHKNFDGQNGKRTKNMPTQTSGQNKSSSKPKKPLSIQTKS